MLKNKAGRGAELIKDALYGFKAKGKLDKWPSFVSMISEKPFEDSRLYTASISLRKLFEFAFLQVNFSIS